MKTATVTYVAPIGDSKTVEMGGLVFTDGKAVEINDHDNSHLFNKLQGNQYFDFAMGAESDKSVVKPPVKRGRPSNLDKAAAAQAAAETEQAAKDAKLKADEAKATHDAILKEEGAKQDSPAKTGFFAKPSDPKLPAEPHPLS